MRSWQAVLVGLGLGVLVSAVGMSGLGRLADARQVRSPEPSQPDSDELSRLYEEDQADRRPEGGKPIDWAVVLPRDRRREAQVKALYEAGEIRTGKDYHRASMVLQHASKPDDFLLAHEFSVVALSKGERDARWLAAATEDRFLMNLGRPQRFGTQYRSSGDDPIRLYEVGPGVTDGLRRELGVPTLAEARKREHAMREAVKGTKPLPPKP